MEAVRPRKKHKRRKAAQEERVESVREEPKEDRSEIETNGDEKKEQIAEESPSKVVEKEDGEESTVEVGVVHEETDEAIVETATRSEESVTEVATNDEENVESRVVEEVPMAMVTESNEKEEEPRDVETVAIATDTPDEEPKEIERELQEEVLEAENQESSSERVAYPRLERERADHRDQEPFSEETLALYYENPELDRNEVYIDEFLRTCSQERFEFYEIVMDYYKAKVALEDTQKEIKSLMGDYGKQKEKLWRTEEKSLTEKGKCMDGKNVTHTHNYKKAIFNADGALVMNKILKSIREKSKEELGHKSYLCQLARVHVDMYISDMLGNLPYVKNLKPESPLTAWPNRSIPPHVISQLDQLRNCVSVLFSFERKPLSNAQFCAQLRVWIDQLLTHLLRVSTLRDHLFVLNHVLRCPAGVGEWAAKYIQLLSPTIVSIREQPFECLASGSHPGNVSPGLLFRLVPPTSGTSRDVSPGFLRDDSASFSWGGPLLDHLLTMLVTLLLPVRRRSEMLAELEVTLTPTPEGSGGGVNWTFLDEDGEEDEEPAESFWWLKESDFISLFNQFPMTSVFQYILGIDSTESESPYSVEDTTSFRLMRLFAFATRLMKLLSVAFTTLQQIRYKRFVQMIGRTIRQTVHFMSDHWISYYNWRTHILGETEDELPRQQTSFMEPRFTLKRLRTEFDALFIRAVKWIQSAHRLGAWQFLADMPYGSISVEKVWEIFWFLVDPSEPEIESSDSDWERRINDENRKSAFADYLIGISESETVFLLTTLANMATARDAMETDFAEAVSLQIYEVSQLQPVTREVCGKTGRDLLGAIAGKHPRLVSFLLSQVRHTIDQLGKACIYLFKALPVSAWNPKESDIQTLREFLLCHAPASARHHLARSIISDLNWGVAGETDELALPNHLHIAMATLLVEVEMMIESNEQGADILARFNLYRLGAVDPRHDVTNWLWNVALSLCLHKSDRPTPVLHSDDANRDLVDFDLDPTFAPVRQALKTSSLACFIALSASHLGHNLEKFCVDGLPLLERLVESKNLLAALKILSNIILAFSREADRLLDEPKFVAVIHSLALADMNMSGFIEKLTGRAGSGANTKLLTSLVHAQMSSSQRPGSLQTPKRLAEFWTRAFTGLNNWHKEKSIQRVLDGLIMSVFKIKECREIITEVIYEKYDEFVASDKSKPGLLGALFSLAGSGGPPSFLDHTASEHVWLSYVILSVETEFEKRRGLIDSIDEHLQVNPKQNPDQALKAFFSRTSYPKAPFSSSRLSIHRWAERAQSAPFDHPGCALMWSAFFARFFYRRRNKFGAPNSSSQGTRFFANFGVLRAMKAKLTSIAEKHKSIAQSESDRHDVTNPFRPDQLARIRFHSDVGKFYYGLSLWVEEPLLHSPSLYLPDLPLQYLPDKLEDIMSRDASVWLEVVDWVTINTEVQKEIADWIKATKLQSSQGRLGSLLTTPTSPGPDTAESRIMARLRVPSSILPAPPLHCVVSAVRPLEFSLLCDKTTIVSTLHRDLLTLIDFARGSSDQSETCVALDLEYLEILPKMYFNEEKTLDICVPCRNAYSSNRRCTGPARLILKYFEKQAVSHVIRRVEGNRAQYVNLIKVMNQGVNCDVPYAAVRLERAITLLAEAVVSNHVSKESCLEAATLLFYHVVNLYDDPVRSSPSMRQLFTHLIDALGQEFIAPFPEKTHTLLHTMLEYPKLAPLLGPLFLPTECPGDFISMYQKVTGNFLNDTDLSFSLLTKFDVQFWLNSHRPLLSDRQILVSAVGSSLAACGVGPDVNTGPVFEVLRSHLRHLLQYQFPSLYGDVLKILLNHSGSRELCPVLWEDFLAVIGCPFRREPISDEASKAALHLAREEVFETADSLASFFNDLRVRLTPSTALPVALPALLPPSLLYSSLQPYVHFIGCLMAYTGQLFVAYSDGEAVQTAWDSIIKLFHPWIHMQGVKQMDGTTNIQPPWMEIDSVTASDMIGHFVSCVVSMQSKFPNLSFSPNDAMSLLWNHYRSFLSQPGVPLFTLVIYNTRFVDLPWNEFLPTPTVLNQMIEMEGDRVEEKFAFLSRILPLMNWSGIVERYEFFFAQTNANSQSDLLASLLLLLVMMLTKKRIMEAADCTILSLVHEVKSFSWSPLSPSSYEQVIRWQEEHCNPHMILEEKSCLQIAIHLLRTAAGFTTTQTQGDMETMTSKRSTCVRLEVSLILRCTSRSDVSLDLYIASIRDLYRTIEAATISDGRPATPDVVLLLSEFLNLLNNCPPNSKAASKIFETVIQSISSPSPASSRPVLTLPTLSAACRSLASMSHMTSVLEAALVTHFKFMQPAPPAQMSWLWSEVLGMIEIPELSVDEFVVSCLANRALLTLYAHALKRLPMCESLVVEFGIFRQIGRWCCDVQMTADGETKILLLWHKVVELGLRQLDFGASSSDVAGVLTQLANSMTKRGEDKETSGILGAIGLGKKSPLTTRFRLICRVLSTCLLLQLPPDLSVRLVPGGGDDDSAVAAMTSKLVHALDLLATNRTYADFSAVIQGASKMMTNTEFTMRDVPTLIGWLVRTLYPDNALLSIIQT